MAFPPCPASERRGTLFGDRFSAPQQSGRWKADEGWRRGPGIFDMLPYPNAACYPTFWLPEYGLGA